MNTGNRRRPWLALIIATIIGVSLGHLAVAVAADSAPDDSDIGVCSAPTVDSPAIAVVPEYPPSDFLRGVGRTAPVPH